MLAFFANDMSKARSHPELGHEADAKEVEEGGSIILPPTGR